LFVNYGIHKALPKDLVFYFFERPKVRLLFLTKYFKNRKQNTININLMHIFLPILIERKIVEILKT